jgi:hypothetical protein
MPVAMFRHDSMALDELKEIQKPESRSHALNWDPLKGHRISWASSPTDLSQLSCDSSSDSYLSDGCVDDDVELSSAIWTFRAEWTTVNEESEDIEDPQIISPFVDTESIAINPDLWACPTSAKIPYYHDSPQSKEEDIKLSDIGVKCSARATLAGKSKKCNLEYHL